MLDKLDSSKNFIFLLKGYKCSEEIINEILKFSDQDFNLLLTRVENQSELLTTLIENGYGSEAFKSVFCEKNDEVYNAFLKYKEFVTLLLENKCELKSIKCVYDLVRYDVKPHRVRSLLGKHFPVITTKFMGHYNEINIATEMYDCFVNRKKIVSRLSYLLKSSEILKCAWQFISSVGTTAIDRYRESPKLFYIVLKNGMTGSIERLITLDKNKQDFIVNYLPIFSLGDITILELQSKSIEEVAQKVEMSTKEKVNKNREQLGLPPNLIQSADFSYAEKGVQSLRTLTVAKVVECLQNKNTFLQAAEVASIRANSSRCAIS